jgi:pyrroline-5-carboxylate reductase
MLRELGEPQDLRTQVTSPGGTTAAAIAVLEDAGARAIFAKALTAARDRSKELGS